LLLAALVATDGGLIMAALESGRGAILTEVEQLLYREAELLDAWMLDDWLKLLTDGASYYVPPTDKPEASHEDTLFIIADDAVRLKERVIRLKDPSCHVEYPPSRTRRLVTNVRVLDETQGAIGVKANFVVYRNRRGGDKRTFTGEYRYVLHRQDGELRIHERRAILDAEELGELGSVSFIL
jgi:p-cumate 2,3-dioxygenase subunit beta